MKPPTDILHPDYLQPSEVRKTIYSIRFTTSIMNDHRVSNVKSFQTSSPSLKSPLELLANACNKLETDMMSTSTSTVQRKLSSPPTTSPHLPQLRLPPTRHTSEPISLVTRPSSTSSSASVSSLSTAASVTNNPTPTPGNQAKSPVSQPNGPTEKVNLSPPRSTSRTGVEQSSSEPLSLISKPKSPEVPENLSKRPEVVEQRSSKSPGTRPEVGSIRVRPAEALSPAGQPPAKKPRESPSPRLNTQRPPSSSPVPLSNSSPRPPTNIPGLPPGFPPGLAGSFPGVPGAFPPSSFASLYSPYSSPYMTSALGLGAMSGAPPPPPPSAPGAPCTDPMCRDPSCPTYQLRAAQAAQMMALSGLGSLGGYPGMSPYPGMAPSLPGLPPSMLPSFPGAGPTPPLPGMLPPSLLAPPTAPPATPPTSQPSLPLTVGGASQFMCSWMQGRDFCGRRFNSSEELMSHLRTHTANMGDTPPTSHAPPSAPSPASAPPTSALALLQAQAAQLRGQLSPNQAPASTVSPPSLPTDPRLHPYLRPGLTPPNPASLNPMLASLYGGSPRQLPVLP